MIKKGARAHARGSAPADITWLMRAYAIFLVTQVLGIDYFINLSFLV